LRKKSRAKNFKAKAAIEALRGEKTIQELSQKHGVHPNLTGQRKKQLVETASDAFDKKKDNLEKIQAGQKTRALYGRISMLQMEKEYLKKNTGNHS